ncbi:MAG TPA: 6-phosphogluconolactonase, partial [Ktedonobacteraceae bacterium]
MQIAIYPDTTILSSEAAKYIVRLAHESIVTRGRFSIALSGGSTPKTLYGLLATEPYRSQLDWSSIEIFWSDERCVPPDSAESNYAMTNEVLLSKIPIQANHIHRMPADKADRVAASQEYTLEMQR